MARTIAVTGSASGIGRATAELLEGRGHRVIGIDRHDADVIVDLATPDGRAAMMAGVEQRADGRLDAVIAVAGVPTRSDIAVRVNFFGAVAAVEGLRPLLAAAGGSAAIVTSLAVIDRVDDPLVDAMLADDETGAATRATELVAVGRDELIYSSTKRALAERVRARAVHAEWAGAGLPLNTIAPGLTLTPFSAPMLTTPEARAAMAVVSPTPLHGPAEPVVIARALAWITGPENTHVTGQTLFVDGGGDAVLRGPRVFGTSS
jgi:NAD(P)-dependent dehydrogenase (short-subunit alcohol dehydrogenase family)